MDIELECYTAGRPKARWQDTVNDAEMDSYVIVGGTDVGFLVPHWNCKYI